MADQDHDALIDRVTTGFGALLEQVQELAAKNDALHQRLFYLRNHAYRGRPITLPDDETEPDHKETTHSDRVDDASQLDTKAGIKDTGDLASNEQQQARAIADGVQAWKKLTTQQVPDPTDAVAAAALPGIPSTVASNPSSAAEGSGHEPRKLSDTTHSTDPREEVEGGPRCAFASTFGSMPTAHPLLQHPDSTTQRPDSLPTPPEIYMDPQKSPTASKRKSADVSSAPPSATGSASKCPIRFLDHYSPEEVAEYFKNHKHEIPRSHEVCVKRYQSNAESIRQLDAKYGNLVNMIQGLGAKHQPLLPAQEDVVEESAAGEKATVKIEKWAEGINDAPTRDALDGTNPEAASNARLNEDTDNDGLNDANSREGRFERPLKDIRVGESPSRPWGISVPFVDGDPVPSIKSVAEGRDSQTPPLPKKSEKPTMVFTGPVFIGYGPEEAAALLRQTGWATRREGD